IDPAPDDPKPSFPTPRIPEPEAPGAGDAITFQLNAAAYTVNVMKTAMPRIPQFPALNKKPGFVRGYVYDTNGRPLKGARLGVRSTAVGGFYSGGDAGTDEKGYYEVAVPSGVAHFYCAGYVIEYGEGIAALGLHPADGAAESFASPNGEVENFVLLPYGIADRAGVQDNPRYCNNYYGGTVILSWYIDDDRPIFSNPKYLPNDSEIEFTLTPDGPLIDGSRGRPIVIRKKVSSSTTGQLYINNIPVGPYQVTAKLVGGGALRMRETGPNGGQAFGIEPKEATGKAALLLRPSGAKANSAGAAHGNWAQISISLERR
ncbi:MAG TPA: hypothetical protein VK689_07315, partial [Armatimonadota bacterium]|nr:hypothetical protein [Armatimonadota bacterium]